MRCLKCKKEIEDEQLRCNFCNTKLQTVCPICSTKNHITEEFCAGCGLQLIKFCPACKCVNLPNAKKCRKCAIEFETDEETISITDLAEIETPSIQEAPVEKIIEKTVEVLPEKALEDNFKLEEFTDDDFNVEELGEDELIDFSDGDILSLSEVNNKIAEGLKKENIEPAPIINSSLLGNLETTKPIIEEKQPTPSAYAEITEPKLLIEEPQEQEPEQEPGFSFETIDFEEEETQNSEEETEENAFIEEAEEIESAETEEQTDAAIEIPENPIGGEIKACDQMKCKNLILNAVRKSEKRIIGLSAPEGHGKSTVLKYLFSDLMHQNYAWLWGECSANSQISPYGIFQEMILTFFNMPNFSNMSADFLKQAKNMLSENFPFLNQNDVFDLFNFLYPNLTSNFEDILINKDKTFALLEKLILEIAKKAKLIIVIDDFDMIDGASYAFLSYFVDRNNLSENIKLIISYKDNRITQGYFYSEKLNENQYEDIRLAKLTKSDADNLIKMYLNGTNPMPQQVFDQVFEYSDGNSAYLEQILVLFNEYKSFYTENNTVKYRSTSLELKLPKNIYEIMTMRLAYLKNKHPSVFRTLCTAATMGNKFNIKLLEIIMKYESEEFQKSIQLLSSFAYISQFNSNIFEFKNTILWKFVYEKAKQSKDFVVLNEKIFDIINSFTLSSNALKALIAQNLNQKLLALNIWTDNIKLCAYLGDEHLWTLSQKQCLKIAQEINPENNTVIINNIQERLGKLLYDSRPSEAVSYLSAAINNAIKIGNKPKIIELSGYLSKSCSLIGNYHGVIEAVDTVLKLIDTPEKRLECALIKHKKLKAMFSIGNAEEIYNLASNEIIPVVEQALSGLIPNDGISMDIIYETWLECNLTVAMALISQGNNKSFGILSLIDEIIVKNNVENKNYLRRVKLTKALANSISGDIKQSEEILISFTQETKNETVEPEIISMWNFINILNKLYKQDWSNIKEDLYSVVTFANNYNDVLVKNLLKVFLGKILQEEGNLSKALDIFNEQVTIFAKEKIAIGALLCWYYIAKITLVTEGSEKALDIAQKALDVAKNPKINNYYFMVLYKKLIAEIFLIKGDTDSAKMYIEKSLMIVKQYDMKFLKVVLYQLYAKYLEEMVNKKPQNKASYAQNAITTYKKALSMISTMEISYLEQEIQKNYSSFKAFCQLNNIKV